MKNKRSALVCLGLGAALMYIFDPVQGPQRRAAIPSVFRRLGHRLAAVSESAMLRLAGASKGAVHGLSEEVTGDQVLIQRVRSEIGHLVAHAQDISVEAHHGHIVLSGRVRPNEIKNVLRRTWAIKGVRDVSNRLEIRPFE